MGMPCCVKGDAIAVWKECCDDDDEDKDDDTCASIERIGGRFIVGSAREEEGLVGDGR